MQRGSGLLHRKFRVKGVLGDALSTWVVGLGLVLSLSVSGYGAEPQGPEPGSNQELRTELLQMRDEDQRVLQPPINTERAIEVRNRNVSRLKEIIKQYGWPGVALVGTDGAMAVWLIVQHADHDVDFQDLCLALLKEAVARGDASAQNMAYLEDRVRANRGQHQVYGTQLNDDPFKPDVLAPKPIENPAEVEQRRRSVGLESLDSYC